MIRNRCSAAKRWSPEGFGRFTEYYPSTEWCEPTVENDRNALFQRLWDRSECCEVPTDISIVLTPGLFAEWLPHCFRETQREFERLGHRVLLSKVRTGFSVAAQAQTISSEIAAWLHSGESFIWCTHSKGGLDALWALKEIPAIRERCKAALAVQIPVGHSWVIHESWNTPRTLRENLTGRLLRSRRFAGGTREITRDRNPAVAAWLDAFVPAVPVLHAVSWSNRATSWVDSYHRQLNRLRPGHAHDGQFYLTDQLLPETDLVCLPELDHAQPVLGGRYLEVGRLWRTLLATTWLAASDLRN